MKIEYWFPVLTLIAGWFLNELSCFFRLRREERKPFAIAMTDLLDIRHRLRAVSTTVGEIKKRFPMSPDNELVVRRFCQDFIAQTETLQRRYNEAVTLIATVDPILAFRLRSKDEFPSLLQQLRPFLDTDVQTRPFVAQIEAKLSCAFLEYLEESIVQVAKAHSMRTWWRIRKYLRKHQEMPKAFDEFVSLVQEDSQQPSESSP